MTTNEFYLYKHRDSANVFSISYRLSHSSPRAVNYGEITMPVIVENVKLIPWGTYTMSSKRIFLEQQVGICPSLSRDSYTYWSPKQYSPNKWLNCMTCRKRVSREGECAECTLERLRAHPSSPAYRDSDGIS